MDDAGEIAGLVCAWVMLWGIDESLSGLTWLIGNLFFPLGETCIGHLHAQSQFSVDKLAEQVVQQPQD